MQQIYNESDIGREVRTGKQVFTVVSNLNGGVKLVRKCSRKHAASKQARFLAMEAEAAERSFKRNQDMHKLTVNDLLICKEVA